MMNIHCSVYTIFIIILLLDHTLISGCAVTFPKHQDKKGEALDSRQLFQDKCSQCHDLPDIDAYPYAPDDWASIVDDMIATKEAGKHISSEEAEKIKNYLRRYLNANRTKVSDIGKE